MAASTVSSSVIPQPQEINRLTDNQAWDLPDEVICGTRLSDRARGVHPADRFQQMRP